MDKNEEVYGKYMHMYYQQYLEDGERTVLKRLKGRWADMDVLDIGVGMGRTAFFFSTICRNYTGIDYVARAVEMCRERVGEDDTVRFMQCDARRLSEHFTQKFDFIMFALCGLDSVDHEGRYQCLREIRKCLKDDGYFYFSAHSLDAPPRKLVLPRFHAKRPFHSVYWIAKNAIQHHRLTQANRHIYADKSREWAVMKDDLDYEFLDMYYISPRCQLRQLAETGFRVVEVWGRNGQPVDCTVPRDDLWLNYLCQPAVAGAGA